MGQFLHAAVLVVSAYFPLGQFLHPAATEFENFPRAHAVQVGASAPEYLPAGQALQDFGLRDCEQR